MPSSATGTETATEARLRALLYANAQVIGELDLGSVLLRVVEVAVELAGARYGALGVIGPDAQLERFIYVGMTAEQAQAIGHVPHGEGLLGALIRDPRSIRVDEIGADPRSVGFPAHHPPMHEFLGVPIRSRDHIFGNLYLAEHAGGFSAADEETVVGLAATAGLAIENARLFAETAMRHSWAAASAELAGELLQTDAAGQLPLVAERVNALATMADVSLHPVEEEDPELAGIGEAAVVDRLSLVLPLFSGGTRLGSIVLRRGSAGRPFTDSELEIAGDFVRQASVAITLARARDAQQQIALVEDRKRIARDLHDHVIQQLFGVGLAIQGLVGDDPAADTLVRLRQVTADLDEAISQIRLAIFAISPQKPGAPSLRHRVLDVVEEYREVWPRAPRIDFRGVIDSSVTGALADDVLAVVREALANAARHAQAGGIAVTVWVDEESVGTEIVDDGAGGVMRSTRRSGLANLEERAARRGGGFAVTSGADGTRLSWWAPLAAVAAHP